MDSGDGRPVDDRDGTDRALDAQDELHDRWDGEGRLRFSYTLRTIFSCSDSLILGTMERAAARDSLIQMHVAEIPRSWPTPGPPGAPRRSATWGTSACWVPLPRRPRHLGRRRGDRARGGDGHERVSQCGQ